MSDLQYGHSTETYGAGVPEVFCGEPNRTLIMEGLTCREITQSYNVNHMDKVAEIDS